MMKEKNTQKTQDLKFLDPMLLVFENFGGKTPRHTKLKNFKIKTQRRLKNTLKIHKNTKNKRKNTKLKIFRKPRQIFEN